MTNAEILATRDSLLHNIRDYLEMSEGDVTVQDHKSSSLILRCKGGDGADYELFAIKVEHQSKD
ncbi:MAG: hypothetical protein AAFY82_00170 [Pseudomonadota bacterium]